MPPKVNGALKQKSAEASKLKTASKAKSATAKKATARCSVRKLFTAIDANESGTITLAEITKAFKEATSAKKTNKSLTYPELTAACNKPHASSARRGGWYGADDYCVDCDGETEEEEPDPQPSSEAERSAAYRRSCIKQCFGYVA